MLTIDEAIARFEANAEQNERWASGGLNPEANAEYAAEHRQLAAWLRELAERRMEQYLTIEQIVAAVGPRTIHSAWLWIEFARTLDILGYAVVERRTDD